MQFISSICHLTRARACPALVELPSVAIMPWSGVHRGFVVRTFFENNHSIVATQRAFRLHFNIPRHGLIPDSKTIRRWIKAIEGTGSTYRPRVTGRPRTVRTAENATLVRAAVEESPGRSARRHSLAMGMSDRSFRRILHLDLKFHPYKIMLVQELKHTDFEKRKNCSQEILNSIPEQSTFFSSDEAHFYVCGSVNKQNFRYWAQENPRELHQRPLHSAKVTVWCAISKFGVIGPYFFEENGSSVTVNSERYFAMLETFLEPKLEELSEEINLGDIWFQQDGATAHTAQIAMAKLRQMFPSRLVSRWGDVEWPPRSPDLSICDFFLWGYLKEKVFKHRPRNLEELKMHIRDEIAAIPPEMCRRAAENFRHRLQMCIDTAGHHLPDVIFKT